MQSQYEHWKRGLSSALDPSQILDNVPLAPFTTFRIGGPADLFFRATDARQLVAAVEGSRELEIPTFLLGRGANVLVGDRGFRGLVIRCEVGGIQRLDDRRLRAGAGVNVFPDLIMTGVQAGLGGLHHFAGIPSTVGGAIWQNLHFLSPAPERDRTVFIQESVESAEIFSQEGVLKEVGAEYFRFGYDYSILHDRNDIVLSVLFRLHGQNPEELRRIMRENLEWRSQRHPDLHRLPSAGSIFKKVEGVGAGRLIDECGLKGLIHGGAQIFPRHANIIVNRGGATALDVVTLMETARDAVLKDTGHLLEPEITLLGEF